MDLDLGIEATDLPVQEAHVEDAGLNVTMADSAQTRWLKKRKLAADLVAAGEFEEALGLLRRRLGIINADPLEPLFKEMYWATCNSLQGPPQSLSLMWPMLSEGNLKSREVQPVILYTMQKTLERVKEGHKLTHQGKFSDALAIFRTTLQAITLSVANDQQEEQQLLEVIDMCREYVNLCRLEVTRKGMDQTSPPTARMVELAAYMTCCKVQPVHLMLTLQLAMTISYKAANYVTAASFAKRLIQGFSNERNKDTIAKARQLVAVCEQRASDAHSLKFDIKAPPESFKLCSGSLTPIAATDPTVSCPFCGASFHTEYKGKLCDTCQLSEVGLNALGIQLRPI
jgi:coatomer protein complex subunit alpha (xenin)